MACAQPQDDDDLRHPQLDNVLERITSHLANSGQNVLALLNERIAAFEELFGRTNGDVLWRRDGLVSTDEASSVITYLNNAWTALKRTQRDVKRPLNLAERAARKLLEIPENLAYYEAAKDVDIDSDELQRRINESQRSNFWRRIAYRVASGSSPRVKSRAVHRAVHRAQIATDLLGNTIKYWTEACQFLNGDMNVANENLQSALSVLQAASDRTGNACPELAVLATELRQILTSIDEKILKSFHSAVRTLLDIQNILVDERDESSHG